MEIEGGRVRLRPFRPGDERELLVQANDREVWRNLTDRFPHPYTLSDARTWVRLDVHRNEPPTNFAILVDGSVAGSIGFERKEDLRARTAEIGYWLGRRYWNRGLATEALRLVTGHAFDHFDFERLEALVIAWNPASCRVLEKSGYTLESRQERGIYKDGVIADGLLYVKLRPRPEPGPAGGPQRGFPPA